MRDPQNNTYTNSRSNEFEIDNKPCKVVVFFSSEILANACIKNEWARYEVCGFDLAEFMESWCAALSQSNAVVGADFDANLYGFEADPIELLLDIISELKAQNKEIELQDI